jgi:putative transposase
LFLSNSRNPIVFREIEKIPLLNIKRGEPLVAIGAYCLMPNHFHILVKEITEGGLTSFMSKLATGYSMYFNKVHTRIGPLFQSRFKAEHVDRDEYLKYLFAYIHLNPVKLIQSDWKERGIDEIAKTQEYLRNFFYSSYVDYLGVDREEKILLSPIEFPEYFDKAVDFKAYVNDWLEFSETEPMFGGEQEKQGFVL